MKNLRSHFICLMSWLVILLIVMTISTAWASGSHRHRHHHVNWGISLGSGGYYPGYYGAGIYSPGVWSPGFYNYRSYNYWDPFFMRPPIYAPPIMTVPVRPPVYIQREELKVSQPQAGYWYYCQNPAGYYPTVKNCSRDWILVPPRPPEQ